MYKLYSTASKCDPDCIKGAAVTSQDSFTVWYPSGETFTLTAWVQDDYLSTTWFEVPDGTFEAFVGRLVGKKIQSIQMEPQVTCIRFKEFYDHATQYSIITRDSKLTLVVLAMGPKPGKLVITKK